MRTKIVIVAIGLISLLLIGARVHPEGTTPARDVRYAERGNAAILYDAHESMRQFHRFRSLANVSYKVMARNARVLGAPCERIDVVQVYSFYGVKTGRYWLGCVEGGYL